MNFKKAILNRKIKAHNIENHLAGLLKPVTPRTQQKMLYGDNKDVMRSYFVGTNKPVATLPQDKNRHLAFKMSKQVDSNLLNPNMPQGHRKSASELMTPDMNSKCFIYDNA